MTKPRMRVAAGSHRLPAPATIGRAVRATNAYMRDSQSGVIAARPASLQDHRDEVRRVWRRAAGLTMDMLQNSGRLKGAVDQIIVDTVGVELTLNPQPDLARFGYEEGEAADWIRMLKNRFKLWAWNPAECDFRGKFTLPQKTDIGIRNWLGYGESLGVVEFMGKAQRRRYGIKTGTKFLLLSPDRLVQDTNTNERLFQGVLHDENGRVRAYRFEVQNEYGLTAKRDFPARDADGRELVMHAFDPIGANDVRGITPLAPTFRKYLMGENLDDATSQMAFLQTVYAAVLKSDRPSADVFEALDAMKDTGAEGAEDLAADFVDYFKANLDRAAESELKIGSGVGVSQLAVGESLTFENAKIPGPDYLPFSSALHRETARALGITYGGYTMDYTQATYASTNMENASVWPLAVRRTDRIAAPHMLVPFASWLDEEIEEGRIPFKPGAEAYRQNRDAILWATCLGPSKPTADDEKQAKASTERMLNGTTTWEVECAARGIDPEESFESRKRWHQRHIEAEMPSPFARKMGSEPTMDNGEKKKAER
ncbi:phage portal protein [Rhizobium sp. CFBP 8762]|uniref:phage portal protein n=1 Tax=Rhizobium sp. CFBP 8762 TaxID=2775279 RepID=UPI0017825AE1|nr:phage portal protein [Rhizobium sp. CFBP 8762]MBD8556897.1 phage portal protein [Rhizobium sp. CFBP 8762]